MVTQVHIYPFRFIAVAPRGYKNWLQFQQHYSHSVFNFYFLGEKNSPANVLTRIQTWSQLRSMGAKARGQSWWVSTLRATRPWRHNLCALPLVRCKPLQRQLTPIHYVIGISGILPYNRKHSSFFPPTHGSIILPPRQPRVFSRLARWQLTKRVASKCFVKFINIIANWTTKIFKPTLGIIHIFSMCFIFFCWHRRIFYRGKTMDFQTPFDKMKSLSLLL